MFINVQGTRLAVAHIVTWSEVEYGGKPGIQLATTNGVLFFNISAADFEAKLIAQTGMTAIG